MKKTINSKTTLIFLAAIVIILAGVIVLDILPTKKDNSQTPASLPLDWSISKSNSGNTIVKVEKNIESTNRPNAIITQSTLTSNINDAQTYVNKLISGAKSTLPSLKYITNTSDTANGVFHQKLTGSYLSGKTKVNIFQEIIIKESKVYTLTVSYLPTDLTDAELGQLRDSLVSTYLSSL